MQCESSKEAGWEQRKHRWEQKNHVQFITWDNWATEDIKLDHGASFGRGSIIMRHSATWLSVCWAATMWCPSCLVWICSAGPDGLLNAVPYGIPETLHSPNHNTQTSNCYSCSCDLSTFAFAIHLHGLLFISSLLSGLIELGDGSRIWGTACVPLDVLLVLYFHVFSGLSVLFMLMFVQLRQNMVPVLVIMVQCHYQQPTCWHVLSHPKTMWKTSQTAVWHAAF